MLVGNTGVGKSSMGCRMLGAQPFRNPEKPFEVSDSAAACTQKLQYKEGTWFGKPGENIRVVDTPGLGDPKGLVVDTENMAAVGKYLASEPVNCVLFCFDTNYRINITMRRLINIIVTKVHPADHDKLALVINRYGHTPADKVKLQKFHGLDEKAHQEQRKDAIVTALKDYANKDNLKLSDREIGAIKQRIFFVDSHYLIEDLTEHGNDEQAWHGLRDWCMTCPEINRTFVAEVTGNIYPEWQAAQDQAEALKEETRMSALKHQQELAEIQLAAAKAQAAADEKQCVAEEGAKRQMEAIIKKMEDQGHKAAAQLKAVQDDFETKQKSIAESHKKDLQEIQKQQATEQRHAAELQAKQAELDKVRQASADQRYQDLLNQANQRYEDMRYQMESNTRNRGICAIM